MKRFISVVLILSLACLLGFVITFSEDSDTTQTDEAVFEVLYTLPSVLNQNSNIGVNQEDITVVFSEEIDSGYENITFKDSQGNDPIGGVVVIKDGNKAIVKFGELALNTTYTLTIPEAVKSISGKSSSAASINFKTIAKKHLADADFSTWDDGTYTKATVNATDGLYARVDTASRTTMTVADGIFTISNTGTANTFIGSKFDPNDVRLSTAKVVSQFRVKAPTNGAGTTNFGGIYKYNLSPGGTYAFDGVGFSTLTGKGFIPDNDGFYDLTVTTKAEEKSISADLSTTTVGASALYKDNISGKAYNYSVADKTGATGKGTSAVISVNSAAVLKLYHADSVSFASMRQGFYVLPEVLKENGYEEELGAVTYTINTDIDSETLTNIKVNGVAVNATFDSATRKIIVPFELENKDYEITLTDIKSVDGFPFEYEDMLLNIPQVTNPVLRDALTNEAVSDILKAQSLNFTFDYKNTEYEKTLQAIIAEYDGNVLKNVKIEDVVLVPNANGTAVIPYTPVNKTVNMKIMATVWDMRMLIPVCSTVSKTVSDGMVIEAEHYDNASAELTKIINSTAVGGWTNDSYAVYENITLTPYHTQFTAKLLPYKAGTFELRANGVDGKLIGIVVVPEEDALSGKASVSESSTAQYKEYNAVLDTTGIEFPFDLYVVCDSAVGCSTDWYKITPVDKEAIETVLEANTGFYLNPLTANKDNIIVSDESGTEYAVNDVYYTPFVGKSDGLIEAYTIDTLSPLKKYSIKSATISDIDGQLTGLNLDAILKNKLLQSDTDAYISDFYISKSGNVVIRIENPNSASIGIINVSVSVIRNGEALKNAQATANVLDNADASATCNLEGYAPQSGDVLKLFAYNSDLVHIKNSGFIFDVK